MKPEPAAPLRVGLVREELPADLFEGFDSRPDVRVASQTKDRHEAGAPARMDALAWAVEITLKSGPDGAPDGAGRGAHQGRPCLEAPAPARFAP